MGQHLAVIRHGIESRPVVIEEIQRPHATIGPHDIALDRELDRLHADDFTVVIEGDASAAIGLGLKSRMSSSAAPRSRLSCPRALPVPMLIALFEAPFTTYRVVAFFAT